LGESFYPPEEESFYPPLIELSTATKNRVTRPANPSVCPEYISVALYK
jgi:hypothetical protein